MTTNYAAHVSTKTTPQSEPIPGKAMTPNNAGGFGFEISDWQRLDRFLILGAEGGTYYVGERKLTQDNAQCVLRCAAADPVRTVNTIVAVSDGGRAPKNDPAIFALALIAGLAEPATRKLALDALPKVCRIGTHLFMFNKAVQEFRGRGRQLNRAVANWLVNKTPKDLAYQLVKYQSRDGMSFRDILRQTKPKVEGLHNTLFRWAVGKQVSDELLGVGGLEIVAAFERAKKTTDKEDITRLIREYNLPRECVPTDFLKLPEVWEALLEKMPMTAMIRNLATMTRVGLIAPLSAAAQKVADELNDKEKLKKARIHPIGILAALVTYQQGKGERGQNTWTPVGKVTDALDAAFYTTFDFVEPSKKKWLLALDVSGSMNSGYVAGIPGLTPRVGSAAMALVTANVEAQHHFVAFTSGGWSDGRPGQWAGLGYGNGITPLTISPRQRLDDVVQAVSRLPMGGTDCALPMLYAKDQNIPVDVFYVLTDNETWAGAIHPCQALNQYRQKTGIPAKLVVCGMTSTGFSIADPNDSGCLDVIGFDTAVPQVISDFAKG